MEPLACDGVFWDPDAPDRRVPGRVTLDNDRLTLTLFDSLRDFAILVEQGEVLAGSFRELPLLFGKAHDGEDLTLLSVSGHVLEGPFDTVHEDYRCRFLLRGEHVSAPVFDRAWFTFDVLAGWANPPALAEPVDRRTYSVSMEQRLLAEATTPVGSVRLIARPVGRVGEHVHLDQVVLLEVEGEALPVEGVVSDWIRPMQDLLIVALGRPVVLTRLQVRPMGASAYDNNSEVVFEVVQPERSDHVGAAGMRSFDAPTLLLPDDAALPFRELVPAWFDLRGELEEVVTLLCAPFYAPFMYVDHRYASTYQAVEALARSRFAGRQRSKADHQKRVDAACKVFTEQGWDSVDIDWARGVLRNRNDKTQRQLLLDLLEDAGEVGEPLLALDADVTQLAAKARVSVSHGGAHRTAEELQYWLGQALLWVARFHLVREMGLPPGEAASRVAAKDRYQLVTAQLAAWVDVNREASHHDVARGDAAKGC